MKQMSLTLQTMFSDLEQRVHDASFTEDFDVKGSFHKRKRHNKYYWYWQIRNNTTVTQKYVGPVTDKAIADRVARFSQLKDDFDQRRTIVKSLVAAGFPRADYTSGEIILALAKAGFFRLRGVLIGSTGYQCYAGILGQMLPDATLRTQDADFAQFFAIANKIDDAIPSIIDVLRSVDKTFGPIPHTAGGVAATGFINDSKYKVEFLTPNRGSDDYQSQPSPMRALGGASAEPLRFLDFLIHDTIRSVILYEGGVPVTIPSPERYAIHKLIVAERRRDGDNSKIDKDIAQSEHLIEAMAKRRSVDLSAAWQEAWDRGPSWREHLTSGLARLGPEVAEVLREAVRMGAARRRKPFVWPDPQLFDPPH